MGFMVYGRDEAMNPLGGYRQSAAWRDNLHGILKGPSIVFWNVSKS